MTIAKLLSLRGRKALITGTTGGIGRIIAQTFAEMGADLLLVDRPGSDFLEVEEVLRSEWGTNVRHFHCDLENQDQRSQLLKRIFEDFGTLNILVNNAAFVGTSKLEGWATDFEHQTVETWRRAMEVNLTAVFDLCKGLAPLLRRGEGGNIINIASIYGMHGPDWRLYSDTNMGNPAAYAASKGGLIQLTRWLATTLAPDVRVNSISPGGIFRNQPQAFVKRYEERTPLGRMAKEDDIRGAVAYLSSDLSGYVTGQNLAVDGGWGIW